MEYGIDKGEREEEERSTGESMEEEEIKTHERLMERKRRHHRSCFVIRTDSDDPSRGREHGMEYEIG